MACFCILTLLLFQQTRIAIEGMPRRDVWDYASIILTLALVNATIPNKVGISKRLLTKKYSGYA
jgi:hypothetical protein